MVQAVGSTAGTLQGLSAAEVTQRRARGQGYTAPPDTGRSYGQIIRDNLFTFINNLLFGLGLVLVLLGRPTDALLSVGVILINVVVGIVQEIRAKRTLDQIALLNRPKVIVVRDGVQQEIEPEDLVIGDVIRLGAGDQVIVDGTVLDSSAMEMDESLLTGESDLIKKQVGDPLYSGSFCVNGSGYFEAEKVGGESLAGQIMAGAKAERKRLTPLQQEVNIALRVILVLALIIGIIVIVETIVTGGTFSRIIENMVVVVGLVPNTLFLAIVVAYSLGAVRLAGKGALVQQSNAIESLSNVDTFCVDKTGTLTTNRMQVHAVYPIGVDEAALGKLLGDFVVSFGSMNKTSEAINRAYGGTQRTLVTEIPFSSARKWSSVVLNDATAPAMQGTYVLGAPEMMLDALDAVPAGMTQQIEAWATEGLRVLLFAYNPDTAPIDDTGDTAPLRALLTPLGLVSLSDELRAEAHDILTTFRESGVEVKIISGDNPVTVKALATQAGFDPAAKLIAGPDLAQVTDESDFTRTVMETSVFGRITPQQKEQIVRTLRGQGCYVAMTGDGVNDVLSLKQADLGIAMQSGSQATRSVADIVLLNDSFAVIPEAVQEGQRIINGMLDILSLFLTRVFYTAFLLLAIGVFLSLRQSALIALLAGGLPSFALAYWARPGRIPRGRLLPRLFHFVVPAAILTAIIGILLLGVYVFPIFQELETVTDFELRAEIIAQALPYATMIMFCYLIFTTAFLIIFVEPPTPFWEGGAVLANDWRPTLLAGLILVLFLLILYIPPLRNLYELPFVQVQDLAIALLAAVAWMFTVRWFWRSRVLDRMLGIRLSPTFGDGVIVPAADPAVAQAEASQSA